MERAYDITPVDMEAFFKAKERWDSVAKPLGSLGILEENIARIASVYGEFDINIDKRAVVVMCADNGVVCEGVTQSDSSVTAICAMEIADGNSNINKLAEVYNTQVITVDIAIACDMQNNKIINKKVAYGTDNIATGRAMTEEQACQAIVHGMDIVRDLKNDNVRIIITGEMGIGNTTTASALSSVLLGVSPEVVTGRGAGLSDDGLVRKIEVIKRALRVNNVDKNKPIELLSKIGGYDIAGMVGLFLGGAYYHVPVVIDGVISAVSALLASMINPLCKGYMLASHVSGEPAGKLLLEKLGLCPVITANMRLGEGTGGIMLLPLLDGALAVYNSAHRFEDISIERYERF